MNLSCSFVAVFLPNGKYHNMGFVKVCDTLFAFTYVILECRKPEVKYCKGRISLEAVM